MPKHSMYKINSDYQIFQLILLCAIILFLGILIWIYIPNQKSAPHSWQAVVCDVGQGSAALLRTGDSSAILIDTGSAGENLEGCLRWAKVERLDLILISHEHEDHNGNLAQALTYLSKEKGFLLCSAKMIDDCGLSEVGGSATTVQVSTGQTAGSRYSSMTFLWPKEGDVPGVNKTNINNQSVIVYAIIAPKDQAPLSIILPGDAEEDALEAALSSYSAHYPLQADLLVLPHHGSKTSGTTYLDSLSISYTAISAGKNNRYGHPHSEITTALEKLKISTSNTADHGHLAFWKEGSQLLIDVQKK